MSEQITKPLPCIVCGTQPEPVCNASPMQPFDAVMFDAGSGHYGSSVWDEVPTGSRSLTINVCDKCLVERCGRVAMVRTIRQAPEVEFLPWRTGDGDE